jgi:HK97 family phage major capsid protein
MADVKALNEERNKLYEDNKALLDKASAEKRTLSTDETVEFDKREARMTELRGTIDRATSMAAEEAYQAESRGRKTSANVISDGVEVEADPASSEDYRRGLKAWMLGGDPTCGVTADDVAAARRAGMDPSNRQLNIGQLADRVIQKRALSIGTTTAGGNIVVDELTRNYWDAQKWFGSMRQVSTIWRTSTGAPLPIPNGDDTANVGEIIGEGSAVTTTADPTFSTLTLGAFKYSSKAVIVSVELLQDAGAFINLPAWLGQKLGERIARIQNTHFTVGAGTTLPFGVATQASLGKTAAATNAITFDELIDLEMSLDRAYRDAPGAGFMMNDVTAAMLRKVKDSNNQYLWQMSAQEGTPDRIFGRPVYINGDLDSPTATNKRAVLYGDYRNYIIRDSTDVIFIRSDELRVLNHQVVFLSFQRSDGNLPNTSSIKYLRTA